MNNTSASVVLEKDNINQDMIEMMLITISVVLRPTLSSE
jgi:hypothetical protein